MHRPVFFHHEHEGHEEKPILALFVYFVFFVVNKKDENRYFRMKNTPHNATLNHSASDVRGISLAEILVGVVLICIAIAIALPNILETLALKRHTQAIADMRHLQIAIEAYKTEEGFYPPCDAPDENPDNQGEPLTLTWQDRLTSPTAYLKEPLLDPFTLDQERSTPYFYQMLDQPYKGPEITKARESGKLYMLISRGYSHRIDVLLPENKRNLIVFDPTNGIKSSGDIVHFGP